MNTSNSTAHDRNANFRNYLNMFLMKTLSHYRQMSPKNWASRDVSFEFITATTVAITVFRDTLPRTPAFRKYPPTPSSGSNMETGSSPKRLSMWTRWQGVTQDKEIINIPFYEGTWKIIWVTECPQVSIRAQNELSNSLILPSIRPARQSRYIN